MVFYPVSDTTFVSCLQTLNLVQYGTLQWVIFEWKEHVKVILWRFISVACVVLVPGHYRVSVDSIGTCPSSLESFGTWPECSCLKRTGGALFDSADGPKSLSLTLSLSLSLSLFLALCWFLSLLSVTPLSHLSCSIDWWLGCVFCRWLRAVAEDAAGSSPPLTLPPAKMNGKTTADVWDGV